jgi:Transposase, Mutator family
VAEQLRPRWPKLADLMDASELDVLAYMSYPRQHRTKLQSTNPIERLNKEVKRRADVVGIFPNDASIMRLIGAVLFKQNDEWQTSSDGRGLRPDRHRGDRPHSQHHNESRLIMPSGHPGNYTSLTDVTLGRCPRRHPGEGHISLRGNTAEPTPQGTSER